MSSYSYEIGKEGTDNAGFCLTMTNTEKKDNNWGAQVWYQFAVPLTEVQYNIWAVFFVGVPVQIALILGTKLHRAGVHWLRR